MKKDLLTYAIMDECIPITLKDSEIIYILASIRKAKATMKVTETIYKEKNNLVLNMRTTGWQIPTVLE